MPVTPGTKSTDFSKSKFLKGADIPDDGVIYQISDVNEEYPSDDTSAELKLVVYFHQRERGVILNKINNRRLTKLFGDDPNLWVGKWVKLYVEPVNWPPGTTTMAIRVWSNPVQPPAAQPVAQNAPAMPEAPPVQMEY